MQLRWSLAVVLASGLLVAGCTCGQGDKTPNPPPNPHPYAFGYPDADSCLNTYCRGYPYCNLHPGRDAFSWSLPRGEAFPFPHSDCFAYRRSCPRPCDTRGSRLYRPGLAAGPRAG